MSILTDVGNVIVNTIKDNNPVATSGVQTAPTPNAWQLVKDSAGTIWLTKSGVSVPYGIRSIGIPAGDGGFPLGTSLSRALGSLGATGQQAQGIQQAVDSGAIMQGSNKVGAPISQRSGTTLPQFGQKPSGSEATNPPETGGQVPGNVFNAIGDALSAPLDFLKLIAWIFHPRNILRGVEFLTGVILIGFGLWAAVQGRGERSEGFATSESALSRSGLGRVSRELASAAVTRKAPSRPRSAPHVTRRTALRTRYEREENVSRQRQGST